MSFNFGDDALVDARTFSRFFFKADDGSSGLTAQDIAAIELAMGAVCAQIKRHVGSEILEGTYTEVWDGAASDELVPTERPITAVSSIKFAPNGDFSTANVVPSEAIFFDKYSIKLRGMRYPFGTGMTQVIYTAGYPTIPKDIQLAVIMQFQWVYKQIGKGDAMVGLKSIAKMQESQTKDDSLGTMALRSEVVGMLENYRRFEAPLSIKFARVS